MGGEFPKQFCLKSPPNLIVSTQVHSHPRSMPFYRVIQGKEDEGANAETAGLKLHGTCARLGPSDSVLTYVRALNTHVRVGTRSQKGRRFISATRDLAQALWWGYGGVSTIIRIELDKLGDKCLAWEIGTIDHDHQAVMYEGQHKYFAQASAEIVFDNDIPAEACKVLKVQRFANRLTFVHDFLCLLSIDPSEKILCSYRVYAKKKVIFPMSEIVTFVNYHLAVDENFSVCPFSRKCSLQLSGPIFFMSIHLQNAVSLSYDSCQNTRLHDIITKNPESKL